VLRQDYWGSSSFLGSTAQLRPWPLPQNPTEFLGGFSTIRLLGSSMRKSRRIRWTGSKERVGNIRNEYKILIGELFKTRRSLGR
jgi:hypothetical protein